MSQHSEPAAVCGNHYAASVELPLLINHTPRWSCKQQQRYNAAYRKLSSASKRYSWAGFSGTAFCVVHILPMAVDMENSWSPASCRRMPPQRPAQGSELQLSLVSVRDCCRCKIKVKGFYRKSPPLQENSYGWTEVEHLQGGREQRSSAEP